MRDYTTMSDVLNREKIEWQNMWWEEANNSSISRIALLGDSVTRDLRSKLNELLKGKYVVDLCASSSQITDKLLCKEIKFFFECNKWKYEVIILQIGGQHGFNRRCDNDLLYREQYKKEYCEIIEKIRQYGKRILFLSSTPTVDKENFNHNNIERNKEIIARNRVAEELAKAYKMSYIDIYNPILEKGLKHTDYIHFDQEANVYIANLLKDQMEILGCV